MINGLSYGTFATLGLVLACSLPICSQTSPPQDMAIRSQQELAIALLKAESERPTDVANLLKNNAQLLSVALWQAFMDAAAQKYSENLQDRSFLLYDIARQVALELNEKKLLARTYYYLGRSYSGLNQFEKAKAAYLASRKAFAVAGLQRDLIYILSDLGTLSLIQEDYAAARGYSEESVRLADSLSNSTSPSGAWPDEYGRAGSLKTLGELAMREGNIPQAIDSLQSSLTLYHQLNKGNSYYDYYVAEVYAALGRVWTSAGDNLQALAFLNKALRHLENT